MDNNQLQLVTFEQAKKLKEAGFDWPVEFAYFNMPGFKHLYGSLVHAHEACDYPSPTVALALKWMRDVKGLLGVVSHSDDIGHWYGIKDMNNGGVTTFNRCYETYERAESALLDELLTLIKK